MKRNREKETAVGSRMAVQVAKFHTQVFQTHQNLKHRFKKMTERLAKIDKQMEALKKMSSVTVISKYRTNTLNYFHELTDNPGNAEIAYLLNCELDCLCWPVELQSKVTNLYKMTIEVATDAVSIKSAPQLPNIMPSRPLQAEKSASENWLDDIDFSLII